MEKVKIRKCESIMNGKAHAIELGDGRKATAWCDKVPCEMLVGAYEAMSEIEIELKPWKLPKIGLNIVAIANYEGIAKEVPKPDKPVADINLPIGIAQDGKIVFKEEDFGEADITSINAKSSVKIKKNSKGIGWEIKVVTGEINLIKDLTSAAVLEHERLCGFFPVEKIHVA